MISGHDKFRFGYGNLGKVRSENLENLKFWKVVRMRHAIVQNDRMPRGILLQRSVFPNMPYRAKNRKFRKLQKKQKIQENCPGTPCSYQPTWAGSYVKKEREKTLTGPVTVSTLPPCAHAWCKAVFKFWSFASMSARACTSFLTQGPGRWQKNLENHSPNR